MNCYTLSVALATVSAVAFSQEPTPVPPATPTIERVTPAAPPVPVEFKCEAGELLRLTIPGIKPDSVVQWRLLDTQNAAIAKCEKGRELTFAAKQPGTYRLLATIDGADLFANVIVGKPTPFVPPVPVPPVDDTLAKKFQAAFDNDPAQLDSRRAQLVLLVALYDAAVKLPDDVTINTRTELMKRLRDLAASLEITGLEDLRRAIAAELNAVLANVVAMDAAAKEQAAIVLAKIRNALKAVK